MLQADLSKSDDRIKDTGGKFQIYAPFNGRNAYKHISKNYYLFYVNENQTYGKERWVIEDLLGKVKAPSGGEYLGLISHEGNETCPEEIGKNWQQVWSHPSIDPEINLYCTGQQISNNDSLAQTFNHKLFLIMMILTIVIEIMNNDHNKC